MGYIGINPQRVLCRISTWDKDLPPLLCASMGHRNVVHREGRSGRIATGPGGIKVGGEVQASGVHLFSSAHVGPRSSMGPSQGVGRVNKVQRLVDYGTYDE